MPTLDEVHAAHLETISRAGASDLLALGEKWRGLLLPTFEPRFATYAEGHATMALGKTHPPPGTLPPEHEKVLLDVLNRGLRLILPRDLRPLLPAARARLQELPHDAEWTRASEVLAEVTRLIEALERLGPTEGAA